MTPVLADPGPGVDPIPPGVPTPPMPNPAYPGHAPNEAPPPGPDIIPPIGPDGVPAPVYDPGIGDPGTSPDYLPGDPSNPQPRM